MVIRIGQLLFYPVTDKGRIGNAGAVAVERFADLQVREAYFTCGGSDRQLAGVEPLDDGLALLGEATTPSLSGV